MTIYHIAYNLNIAGARLCDISLTYSKPTFGNYSYIWLQSINNLKIMYNKKNPIFELVLDQSTFGTG